MKTNENIPLLLEISVKEYYHVWPESSNQQYTWSQILDDLLLVNKRIRPETITTFLNASVELNSDVTFPGLTGTLIDNYQLPDQR